MIKVQTLRLRGLFASSLLALAACSGTPSEFVDVETGIDRDGQPMTGAAGGSSSGSDVASLDDVTSLLAQGQDPQGKAAMVQKAVERARASFNARLFEDARNESAYALELDPNNKEARDIFNRCMAILGTPVKGESWADDLIVQDTVRRERERTLISGQIALGKAQSDLGKHGDAIVHFERAVLTARLSDYLQPNDPLRKEAELMLETAREAKRQADLDAAERAIARSQEEIDRQAQDRQISKELRVDRLLDQANLEFQDGDYEETVRLIDQALRLDPINPSAMELRDLADRARHNAAMDYNRERWRTEWNKTFDELQQSTVPQTDTVKYDPNRWAIVSQRKPTAYSSGAALESPENAKIHELLASKVLEHNFSSATVEDWASFYAQVTGATFLVTTEVKDLDADTTTLSDFRLPRRSVADALKAIQATTGVAYKVKDGLVQLVTPENAVGNLVMKPYTVTDLVSGVVGKPGPDLRLKVPDDDLPLFPEIDEDPMPSVVDDGRLLELITSTIAVDRWDGSPFSISYLNENIYVRADDETHEKVARLVNELRRHVGIQVDIESRFLSVEDSFLQDVGIDLRGLGNQASQGLAGRGLEKQGDRQNAGFDDFGPRQQQNAAVPGNVGTGTEPGIFFDDGEDGDGMARVENLFNSTLGGRNNGLTNAGGLSLQYAFLDDTEVEIVLRAVSKQERSEQIEAPRLLVYNNTRASMHFLRNISYIRDFEVEIAQAAAVANPVIGTVHDGVALDVRPVVDSDLKFITMELRPTVMTLQLPIPTFTTTLGVGQPISIQLPEVTLQRVRTTVTVPDGSTMMLGGMRLVERQNLRSTVPLLGSLPGLSWLFSRNGTSVQNRKMLILIRSKIVLMEEHEPDPSTLPDVEFMSMR